MAQTSQVIMFIARQCGHTFYRPIMIGLAVGFFIELRTCSVLAEPPAEGRRAAATHFDEVVAPLLGSHCLDCHRGAEPAGGLDLSRRTSALEGGESGPAIVPGDLEASHLWQFLDSGAMPPEDRPRLSDNEKAVLRLWIAQGASWGEDPIDPFRVSSATRAGRNWWSLQPLVSATPLESKTPRAVESSDALVVASPIDWAIRRRLEREQLEPSPPTDPRTLIRRLHFDLIGLPPTPEEVAAFVADPSEEAFAAVVDRLLASPRYGERWGRHWLDVVRFGESDGFERNLARETAWPYRNWVIDALNDDMPYDQFVRWQIAGDVLEPENPRAIAATGFLVAGIHNTVVANTETARAFARHEELEDIAATLGQAFLGLTVHCARCHDHKFDPITQEEYYRFVAAFDGIQHGERSLLSARQEREREEAIEQLRQRAERLRRESRELDEQVRRKLWEQRPAQQAHNDAGEHLPFAPRAHWNFASYHEDPSREVGGRPENELVELAGRLQGGARIRGGKLELNGTDAFFESEPLTGDLLEKTLEVWATLDNLEQRGGGLMTVETADGSRFDSLVFGERQPGYWMAGSDSFRRTQDVGGEREERGLDDPVHLAITYRSDGEIALFRDGLPYGKPYRPTGNDGGIQTFSAGNARVLFGKRHTGGARSFFAGTLLDARLHDRALTPDEIQLSHQAGPAAGLITAEDIWEAMTTEQRAKKGGLLFELSQLTEAIDRFPVAPRAYAAVSREPPVMHLLERGDVRSKGEPVSPGGMLALGGDYDFGLPPNADDASRRVQLADWVTARDNPLFARVMVNRLWHYHFGRGIVDTPSDFGFNGSEPTHPELLDYLAAELIRAGYRLKPIHRQIVLSETYRQASQRRREAVSRDADNHWLWRMTPRRLEAEAIRDSMLYLADELNLRMGGPGYQDVKTEFVSGTTYFEPLDDVGYAEQRRTVYRFSPRGERSALLDTFDCPDPSVTAPRRPVTTTPLQALALWNNEFVLHLADSLADRVERETADDSADARIGRMYQLVFQRDPIPREREAAHPLVANHGLVWLARVLLNSHEFVWIE